MIKTRFTIVFIVTMIHWGRVANTSCRYVLHNQKTYWNGRLSQQTTRQRYFFSPYWTILASFPIFPNISVNALYELGFWNVVLQHYKLCSFGWFEGTCSYWYSALSSVADFVADILRFSASYVALLTFLCFPHFSLADEVIFSLSEKELIFDDIYHKHA